MSGSTAVVMSIASILVLAAGCGNELTWHCVNPRKHACSEWSTSRVARDIVAEQKRNCVALGGTVGAGPCTDAGAVGSCVPIAAGGGRLVYYAPRHPHDAQRICKTLGGAWHSNHELRRLGGG